MSELSEKNLTQNSWPDSSTLANIAAVITAFAVAMLFFRIQRELEMAEKSEINWMPWADWLLLGAAWLSLIFVILPLVSAHPTSLVYQVIPPAACAATAILVAGYSIAILAHYRLIFAAYAIGPRTNPEPGERYVVTLTALIALVAFVWTVYLHTI